MGRDKENAPRAEQEGRFEEDERQEGDMKAERQFAVNPSPGQLPNSAYI